MHTTNSQYLLQGDRIFIHNGLFSILLQTMAQWHNPHNCGLLKSTYGKIDYLWQTRTCLNHMASGAFIKSVHITITKKSNPQSNSLQLQRSSNLGGEKKGYKHISQITIHTNNLRVMSFSNALAWTSRENETPQSTV